MPRADPVPLSQLAAGPPGDCYALLSEKTADRTRQGKPFYTCTFRDKTRNYTAKIWADSPTFAECEADWVAGQVYKLRAVADRPPAVRLATSKSCRPARSPTPTAPAATTRPTMSS